MYYEEIVPKANYRLTVAAHREALKLKFKTSAMFYRYGGVFRVTAELLFWLKTQIELGYERVILLDDNETPICIEEPEKCLQDMIDTYAGALNTYYAGMSRLREARSVDAVLDV